MQSLTGKIEDGGATSAGILTAVEWNELPQEVQNTITSLGISLSSGDLQQLVKSISSYVAHGDFYTAAGTDAYVLSALGTQLKPHAYANGMRVRFVVPNTNTGASTVNVASLGVKDIEIDGGALGAGDLAVGDPVELWYDGTAFQLIRLSTAATDVVAGILKADNTVGVTPGRQHYHPGVAKAWVLFDGTGGGPTSAITASYNVTSVTDNGTGDYTVNFTVNFSDALYTYFGSGEDASSALGDIGIGRPLGGTKTTASCRVRAWNAGATNSNPPEACVHFFGDQ
jgi:hypothetical protein